MRDLWRLLVVQTGESVELAKVFRAHAVPQGLCGNLVRQSIRWWLSSGAADERSAVS